MKNRAIIVILILLVFVVTTSCKKEKDESIDIGNKFISKIKLERESDFILSDGEFEKYDIGSEEQKIFFEKYDLEVQRTKLPLNSSQLGRVHHASAVYDDGYLYFFMLSKKQEGDFFKSFSLVKIDLKKETVEELRTFKRDEYIQIPVMQSTNQYLIWLEEDDNRKAKIVSYDLLHGEEKIIRSCVADSEYKTTRFENLSAKDGYLCWYEFDVLGDYMDGNLFCLPLKREMEEVEKGKIVYSEDILNLGKAELYYSPYERPRIYNGYTTKKRKENNEYWLDVVKLSANQIKFSINLPFRVETSWSDGIRVFWSYSIRNNDVYYYDTSTGEYGKIKNSGNSFRWTPYNLKEIYLSQEKIKNTGILMFTQLRDRVGAPKTKEERLYYLDLEEKRVIQVIEEGIHVYWPELGDKNQFCEVSRQKDGTLDLYILKNKAVQEINEKYIYNPERDREEMITFFEETGLIIEYNKLDDKNKHIFCEFYFDKRNKRKKKQEITQYYLKKF